MRAGPKFGIFFLRQAPNNMVEFVSETDLNIVLTEIQEQVSRRRVRLGEFFRDFDQLRHGECNLSSLRSIFTQLRLTVSQEYLNVLIKSYPGSAHDKFNYRGFLKAASGGPGTEGCQRHECDATHVHNPRDEIPDLIDQSSVLTMLQAQVYERRVDFRDFFHDFDHLRKGLIPESKLRCVLSQLNFEVTEPEIASLKSIYGVEGGNVNYMRLCDDVERALICPRLEHDPSGEPPPPFNLFAAKEGKKPTLSSAELQTSETVETMIRRAGSQRGITFLASFRAYDRYSRLVITGNQFRRTLKTLGIEISDSEFRVLLKKYCIHGSEFKFAYRDFCYAIES